MEDPLLFFVFTLLRSTPPDDAATALTTVISLLENLLKDREKYSSVKASSKGLQTRLLRHEGGAGVLQSVGFRLEAEADSYVATDAQTVEALGAG